MEWVLPLTRTDSRGNRRSLTLSSSPTESALSFAVRAPGAAQRLQARADEPAAGRQGRRSELSGDFVLPAKSTRPLVLVAGGIGITPFRAMLRYLVDRGERRDVTLIYATYTADEIAFDEDLEQARRELGVKLVYTLADADRVPADWRGRVGLVDARMIAEEVPAYRRCTFYVSGPPAMVKDLKSTLRALGVRRVRTDFFPGYSV